MMPEASHRWPLAATLKNLARLTATIGNVAASTQAFDTFDASNLPQYALKLLQRKKSAAIPTPTHTHAHTHTHTHTLAPAPTHTHPLAHTHTHTSTQTPSRTHAHTAGRAHSYLRTSVHARTRSPLFTLHRLLLSFGLKIVLSIAQLAAASVDWTGHGLDPTSSLLWQKHSCQLTHTHTPTYTQNHTLSKTFPRPFDASK